MQLSNGGHCSMFLHIVCRADVLWVTSVAVCLNISFPKLEILFKFHMVGCT
jgi:hypothetical protein